MRDMLSGAIDILKSAAGIYTRFTDSWPMLLTTPMTIIVLKYHFSGASSEGKRRLWPLMVALVAFLISLFTIFPAAKTIQLFEFWAALANYSCMLFVLLCEALLHAGFAVRLNRWRGEKWVKELDYVYLGMGAVGLAYSVDRLQSVSTGVVAGQWIGPFLVATALVVRTIKTRADIGNWNKLTAVKILT